MATASPWGGAFNVPYTPVSLLSSSRPRDSSEEKYPWSCPGSSGRPFTMPHRVMGAGSPDFRDMTPLVSMSQMPWPSPANRPVSGS